MNDGPGADVDVQASLSEISANWSGLEDPLVGVTGYEWAIGATPGGGDVLGFVDVGLATSATHEVLVEKHRTYYVTVRAVNGFELTTSVTSDGAYVK